VVNSSRLTTNDHGTVIISARGECRFEGSARRVAGVAAEGPEHPAGPVGDDGLDTEVPAQRDVVRGVDRPHVHRMTMTVRALDVPGM
jgi:hypothetical protein